MLQFTPTKIVLVVATCLLGLIVALPNAFTKAELAGWPSFLPKRQIALGLDLQGGAHLVLEMDTAKLKSDWIGVIRADAQKTLRDAKIGFAGINATPTNVQVRIARPEDADNALKELRKLIQNLGNPVLGTGGPDLDVRSGEGGAITLTPTDQGLLQRIRQAQSAAIETLNRRINAMGTAESTVVPQGRNRILIQYPGLQDTTQLKRLVGETAKLSFHEVHPTLTPEEARATRVPAGYRIFPSIEGRGGAIVLRDTPVVSGEDLVDAQPSFDQRDNGWVISFRFNQAGARKFGNFTRDHVGQPFAIVLDDRVISAPVIREAILAGSGQISGGFTAETATNLAISLRSGALPAKLTIVEERTVGASLGADSVSAGMFAGIVGGVATIILTVLAYGTFGIFACVGLIVHLMLTLALMTFMGSTLTLPGIAGLVLGVAMAVDANVLIYERIREELRAGKTAIAAIDSGFQRAFITIADSQLTTLAAAVIMFWLGSGPIRGFAVTLTFGILTSIFASVTVVRLLISLWLKSATRSRRKIEVPV
jgi:SecD/SecF fusion protein